jgi:hypothetical protein
LLLTHHLRGPDEPDIQCLCLIPRGKSGNIGIEGLTPYINFSINYYKYNEDTALYAVNNLGFSPTQDYDVLTHHRFAEYSKIHQAIDVYMWHNFSRATVLEGAFYQWIDGPYNHISQKPKGELQKLDIYGGCVELKVLIIYPISLKIRDRWDSNHGNRVSYALQLEFLPAQNRLYQPVRRYMMPIQYDSSPLPDIYRDNYRSEIKESARKQREANQGFIGDRIQEIL